MENAIGRLRRPLPRSTKLGALSEAAFTAALQLYNNTPRKCLGYRTPAEVFHGDQGAVDVESNGRRCLPGEGTGSLSGEPGFSLNSALILSN